MPKTLSDADIESFRERLCDVAEELFAAHGPDGVTMRQLAGELNVSPMTAYRYFQDKDAILAAVRTRAFSRFAQAMEDATVAMRHNEPKAWQPGEAYISFALANPSSYRMMFDTYQPTFHDYPDLVKAMERARKTMTAGWRELESQGRFKGDVDLAGHLHWSAMHGAIMLELAGLLRPPMDARAIAVPALKALAKEFGIVPPKTGG